MSVEQKFWSKVDRTGDCWEWLGGRTGKQYGATYVRGKQELAHRVAYELGTGQRPVLFVCHRCDNPPCCNPAHLFEGTNQENQLDASRKGRSAKTAQTHRSSRPRGSKHWMFGKRIFEGEKNPIAKLTDEAVREIRRASAAGVSEQELAGRYNVTAKNIGHVVGRRTWKHV